MEKYESKQHQIPLPVEQIYALVSRFDTLTPALADKVEEWSADQDSCSFKAKGFTVKLRIEERVENKHIKIVGEKGAVPVDFSFWCQLHSAAECDTRFRLVLHAELNMMFKMMIGSKLQEGLEQIAQGIAQAFTHAK